MKNSILYLLCFFPLFVSAEEQEKLRLFDFRSTYNYNMVISEIEKGADAEDLKKKGFNVNAGKKGYGRPLHYFAHNKDKEGIKVLLDAGADPDLTDSSDQTPLHVGIIHGLKDIEALRLLITPETLNKQDRLGRTPLNLATLFENASATNLLLDLGASPNLVDNLNSGPLHNVLWLEEEDEDLISSLITPEIVTQQTKKVPLKRTLGKLSNLGQKILTRRHIFNSMRGRDLLYNPLHIAVETRNAVAIRLLLESEISKNQVNYKEETPLHLALLKGLKDEEIIKSLITPENMNRKDKKDRTALDIAKQIRNASAIKALDGDTSP